ncbi:MAG: RDD family protein [Chloroflexota bacterium]
MTTPAPTWPTPVEPVGPAPGVRFAGHGARLGAYILDAILVGIVTSALFLIVALPLLGGLIRAAINDPGSLESPSTWAGFGAGLGVFILGVLVIGVFSLLYFPFFWARGGATPGMMVAGIRVVNDRDGNRIGWGPALLRLVGFWVSGAVFYLGFIWILVDTRRRGWHDLIAGTCVISTR